jgi:dTDP-4-amino-4,6-dideoxygalactose transaminase
MEQINQRRAELLNYYYKAFIPLVNEGMLKLPFISGECIANSHLFYIILKDEKTRNGLMDHLQRNGILAVFHYIPLHLSPVGKSLGYREGQLPITESMSSRLLRLPFYYDLKRKEQDEVVNCINNFFQEAL